MLAMHIKFKKLLHSNIVFIVVKWPRHKLQFKRFYSKDDSAIVAFKEQFVLPVEPFNGGKKDRRVRRAAGNRPGCC